MHSPVSLAPLAQIPALALLISHTALWVPPQLCAKSNSGVWDPTDAGL